MAKLLLTSVVFVCLAIPVACAGAENGRRGLGRAVVLTALYELLYVFAVLYVYPRL